MYKNLVYEKNVFKSLHASYTLHAWTFDLITNPFTCKCETYLVFIHPFIKIMVSAKCNL
jgi:hypothetical protein